MRVDTSCPLHRQLGDSWVKVVLDAFAGDEELVLWKWIENRMKYFDWKNRLGSEFIRFCIVGVICTGIDAIVFYITRIYFPYQIALICGYLVGLVFNYFLTVYWTFNVRPSIGNAIGIVLAHLINLFIIRMGLMWFFVELGQLHDKYAYVPTVIISVIANFLMVRFVVNKTDRKSVY